MLLKESMFLPVFYLSVTICALVLCPSSFARITKAPNPLLFNNYLSGCKASFEGSTIATLFTKTRHRATCNFTSKQINMKFMCSFSSRSEFLCWSSKPVLFCLLHLAILLWPPASLLSCLITVQTSIARISLRSSFTCSFHPRVFFSNTVNILAAIQN